MLQKSHKWPDRCSARDRNICLRGIFDYTEVMRPSYIAR